MKAGVASYKFCLIPSPLCFPFSLFSLVISDDSTDIYVQIVRGFFSLIITGRCSWIF